MRTRHQRHVAMASCIAVLAVSGGAFAQERSDARTAYDDAARAYEAKDFLRAAEGFARADTLAPNALALKLALAAAVQADAPVLAEELALRAESRDTSPDVQDLARSGHRLARNRVGRIEIICASPSPSCVASVDGRELRGGQSAIVLRGPRIVSFTSVDGMSSNATVDVLPDTTTRVQEPSPHAVAGPATTVVRSQESPARRGLHPVVFWVGTGLTAALAGATVLSGLDANAHYDDFDAARTLETRNAGKSAELRTNILLGSTVVVALVTGAIGIWRTGWTGRGSAPR